MINISGRSRSISAGSSISSYNGTVYGNATFDGGSSNATPATLVNNIYGNAMFRAGSFNRAGVGGVYTVITEKGVNGSSILGVV